MAEREQRRRVEVADLALGRRASGAGTCPAARPGLRGTCTGSRPDGLTRPDSTPASAAAALLAGEERLDDGGRSAASGPSAYGRPETTHEHDRRAGVEQRRHELGLDPGQREVGGVAALARGAAAEQPGPVADHGDAHVGRARRLDRGRDAASGRAPSQGSPARRHGALGQLLHERVEQRRHLDAEAHVRVPRHDAVVGVGVAARGTASGSSAHGPTSATLASARSGSVAVVGQQHDRAPRPARAPAPGAPAGRGPAPRRHGGSGVQSGSSRPELALLPQHPPRRAVDQRLGHARPPARPRPAARRSSGRAAARRRSRPPGRARPPPPASAATRCMICRKAIAQ